MSILSTLKSEVRPNCQNSQWFARAVDSTTAWSSPIDDSTHHRNTILDDPRLFRRNLNEVVSAHADDQDRSK